MTVYVDHAAIPATIGGYRPAKWSHLMADTVEELHEFAVKIGLRREWFQDHPRFPHYDVTESRRKIALANGAIPESTREAIKRVSATLL